MAGQHQIMATISATLVEQTLDDLFSQAVEGDREKPGAENGRRPVILIYYGPAKRSGRNLPTPHPATPDQRRVAAAGNARHRRGFPWLACMGKMVTAFIT